MPVPTLENGNMTSRVPLGLNPLHTSDAHTTEQSMNHERTFSENMILVQVNPGETFTIQDDGRYRSFPGPAQVPMVLHNGAIPPIYVPPGYISQVIEDDGVRRVVVLPNAPDTSFFNMSAVHHQMPHLPVHAFHTTHSFHRNTFPTPVIQTCRSDSSVSIMHSHVGLGDVREPATRNRFKMLEKFVPTIEFSQLIKDRVEEQELCVDSMQADKLCINPRTGLDNSGCGKGCAKPYVMHEHNGSCRRHPHKMNVNGRAGRPFTNTRSVGLQINMYRQDAYGGEHPSSIHSTGSLNSLAFSASQGSLSSASSGLQSVLIPVSTMLDATEDHQKQHTQDTQSELSSTCIASSSSPPNQSPNRKCNASKNGHGPSKPTIPVCPDNFYSHHLSNTTFMPNMYGLHNFNVPEARENKDLSNVLKFPNHISTDESSSDLTCTTLEDWLGNVSKPEVVDITSKEVKLCWQPLPLQIASQELQQRIEKHLTMFELHLAHPRKEFQVVHRGNSLEYILDDLQPGSDYTVRLFAELDSCKGKASERTSFQTLSCQPESPAILEGNRTKNAILLRWKAPNDNGEKITKYHLEWDEGRQDGKFHHLFSNSQKQFKVTKLSPAHIYTFRIAAENKLGRSSWSEEVSYTTAGTVPGCPEPPRLTKATAKSLTLEWVKSSMEVSGYIVEMNDDESGYGFRPEYDGQDTKYTVKSLRRNCHYQFRLCAYNKEGKSKWSGVTSYLTCPDKPLPPRKPRLIGNAHTKSFHVSWDAPEDTGGSDVTQYVVEMSSERNHQMDVIYTGLNPDCFIQNLQPGHTYRLRVFCTTNGGNSLPSNVALITTAPGPPGICLPPMLSRRPKPSCLAMRWEHPSDTGGSPISLYEVNCACHAGDDGTKEVYKGIDMECTVGSLKPHTQYAFCVRAINKAGSGNWSEPLLAVTSAANPDRVDPPVACAISSSTVHLEWQEPLNNGAEIVGYRAQWGSAENSMNVMEIGPVLTHKFNNLAPNTVYYFTVQAVNSVGRSSSSTVTSVTTPPSPPDCVCNLRQTESFTAIDDDCDGSGNSMSYLLEWDPPNANGSVVTSYTICIVRCDNGGEGNMDVEKELIEVDGETTCHRLDLLEPGTSYSITVRAGNQIGYGSFSSSICVKTKPLPPNAPQLSCGQCAANTLKLHWTETPNKTQYLLQMRDKNGRFSTIYRGSSSFYKLHRLSENTDYDFRISASNCDGDGPFSSIYTFSTPPQLPPTLETPVVTSVKSTSCEVSWQRVDPIRGGSIEYRVRLECNDQSSWIYTCNTTHCVLEHLTPGTEYCISVLAVRHYIPSHRTTCPNRDGVSSCDGEAPPTNELPGASSVTCCFMTGPCIEGNFPDGNNLPVLSPILTNMDGRHQHATNPHTDDVSDAPESIAPQVTRREHAEPAGDTNMSAVFLILYFLSAIVTALLAHYFLVV